jgi:hypothetical protein
MLTDTRAMFPEGKTDNEFLTVGTITGRSVKIVSYKLIR